MKTQQVEITRRRLLESAVSSSVMATGGCTLVGANDAPVSAKVSGEGAPKRDTSKHRLYRIVTAAKLDYAALRREFEKHGGLLGPPRIDPEISKRESHYVAWIDADKAKGIKEVIRVEVWDIGEIKTPRHRISKNLLPIPKPGHNRLIVQLGPNSWFDAPKAIGLATTKEIADDWRKQLAGHGGVTVEAIETPTWKEINSKGTHVGARPGQIEIQFPGVEPPKKLLRLFDTHPQVYRVSKKYPEAIYLCPPCGIG